MSEVRKPFSCRGTNYSITLHPDRMILKSLTWGNTHLYELPTNRIQTLIVQRKSVIPFAAFTVIAAVATILLRYNSLWFLVNLSALEDRVRISMIALIICVTSAVPTLFRVLFVNVSITWDGEPTAFLVRFVSAHRGRRLAKMFREISVGS
jgi:hypothetical protein